VARGGAGKVLGAARGELLGIDLRVVEPLEPLVEVGLRWLRLASMLAAVLH
jgi:hypothetical protein